jgi:hypothetical protein
MLIFITSIALCSIIGVYFIYIYYLACFFLLN